MESNEKASEKETQNVTPKCSGQHHNEDIVIEGLLPADFSPPLEPSLTDFLPQIFMGCLAHCTVIQAGINMAYSTILENGLTKNIDVSKNEMSWIASLVTIALPLGAVIVGPLMDRYGRKKICIFSCVPSLVSWAILIVANSVTVIYAARVIAGFSGGLSTASVVYISEIAHPQIRPMLLCFNSIFVSFGILITYCLGVWLTWDRIAIVFFFLNSCILIVLLFIPESPYWIMCFGKEKLNEKLNQVQTVLKFLNRSEHIFQQELQRIIEVSENAKRSQQKSNNSIREKLIYFKGQIKAPSVYKPSVILFVLFLIQQLTGTYVIIFYALSVFESLGGKFGAGWNKYNAMVTLGVLRFCMSVLTALVSKKFGRRILCMTSGLGMAFSMFFLASYIHFTSNTNENNESNVTGQREWILLLSTLFYVCASSLGFVIIPWTLIGELLPISVKGLMGGIMVSIAYVLMFGMVKSYYSMTIKLGTQGVFFFFSATSLIGAIFVYFFVPETLGKSFSEIEKYFNSNVKPKVGDN